MRDKTIKLAVATFLTWALAGCGGESTNGDVSAVSKQIVMVQNKSYQINDGDSIKKVSKSPEVEINSDFDLGTTTAILLSGEAILLKK